MKNVLITALILVFVSITGFAQPPSQAPLTRAALASVLGQPVVSGSCAVPETLVFLTTPPPAQTSSVCSITATCVPSTVSCTGNSTCQKVNSYCASSIQGFVNCDGVVTWCPQCPCGPLWCCQCAQTGECVDCGRCEGGLLGACIKHCSGL